MQKMPTANYISDTSILEAHLQAHVMILSAKALGNYVEPVRSYETGSFSYMLIP
jgi:hypothetical protein